jgi:hypothetical protein
MAAATAAAIKPDDLNEISAIFPLPPPTTAYLFRVLRPATEPRIDSRSNSSGFGLPSQHSADDANQA